MSFVNKSFQPAYGTPLLTTLPFVTLLGLVTISSLSLGPNPIFEDDVFFYWVSALRTVEFGFSTFDGHEPTNGFHWAWYVTLTLFAFLSQGIGESTLTTKAFFLLLPSLIIWIAIFSHVNKSLILLTLASSFFICSTMETSLAGLLLGIGLVNSAQKKSPVLWFTLAMLVRIDLIIAVIIALSALPRRQVISTIGGTILATAASITVNYLLVGEFFTVSSELKASGAIKSLEAYFYNALSNFSSYGNLYRYFVVFALNVLAIFLYVEKTEKFQGLNFLITLLAANSFLIFHSLVSSIRDWYFAPTIISLLILNGLYIGHNKLDVRRRITILLNLTAIAGFLLLAVYSMQYYSSWVSGIDFRKNACAIVKNQRVFVYDGSGKLAWNLYDCATVTNGDGLVNSHAYLRNIIKNNDYLSYLRDNQIRFYINNSKKSSHNCPVPSSCFNATDVTTKLRSQGGSRLTTYTLVEVLYR